MLSIHGTDFIACWAYEERISAHAQPAVKCEHFYMYNTCWANAERILSHTEHTGNWFHRMMSTLGTDFIACWACAEMFKSRISRPNRIRFTKIVLQVLGTIRFQFLQKKSQKISCLCTLKRNCYLHKSYHHENTADEGGCFRPVQLFLWLHIHILILQW
jgi:hypothetical protein